jgi:DnaK suppressor protein
MNPALTDTQGAALRRMRSELIAQIRQQRGGTIGRAEAASNALSNVGDDWAQADAERDLAFALEEREAEELNAIAAALKRLASGEYGQCTDCGAAIAAARLQANPVASRCVACQERVEQAHGGQPHPSL